MNVIESAWLVDERVAVCILRPQELSDRSQYVVMLCGIEKAHCICVTGRQQFHALTLCLTEAGLHMSGQFKRMMGLDKGHGAKRRRAASPMYEASQRFVEDHISVEVVTHRKRGVHEKYEFTVQIASNDAGENEILDKLTDTSESIQMSETELLSIGELLWGLSDAEYEPAFLSTTDEWFVPPAVSRSGLRDGTIPADLLHQAVAHVEEACPQYADGWIECLERFAVRATIEFGSCTKVAVEDKCSVEQGARYTERSGDPAQNSCTQQVQGEVESLIPWLAALPGDRADEYEFEIGVFYSMRKDFAFQWMSEHPKATENQLVQAVLKGQRMLPPDLAKTTAEKVAERVFHVIANY